MDSANSSSTHESADPARRSRRTALVAIGAFVFAVLVTGVVFMWQQGSGRTLNFPGGSLEYVGAARGSPIKAPAAWGDYATDMDGVVWSHVHALPLTWQNHAHRLSPKAAQKYLPANWRPKSAGTITAPYAEVMQWDIQGHFNRDAWRLTWEDENGHESEGTANALWGGGRPEIFTSGTLPPSRSRKVIVRVREYREDKPVKEWPLMGELPMNNPCLVRTPLPAVDKLPVTRTQHGVALTLQAVTVNPNAPDNECTTLTLSMPHEKVQDWSTEFQFFDERRCEVSFAQTSFGRRDGGFLLSTSSSLWSDAPWHVRVSLTRRPGLPPHVGSLFRFLRVPPSGQKRPAGATPKSETAGGHTLTLEDIAPDPAGDHGKLTVNIKRPQQTRKHRLRIVSATDNLGRPYQWSGGYSSRILSSGEVRVGYHFTGPDMSKAESLDVVAAIEEPLTFDFCVVPEFKDLTK